MSSAPSKDDDEWTELAADSSTKLATTKKNGHPTPPVQTSSRVSTPSLNNTPQSGTQLSEWPPKSGHDASSYFTTSANGVSESKSQQKPSSSSSTSTSIPKGAKMISLGGASFPAFSSSEDYLAHLEKRLALVSARNNTSIMTSTSRTTSSSANYRTNNHATNVRNTNTMNGKLNIETRRFF